MPSPFPGMDPYLEHPDYFPGLHGDMITYLKEYLQPRLPPHYLAKTNERVWMEISNRSVEPDVEVLADAAHVPSGTATAVATSISSATAPIVITVQGEDEEFRETFVDIYTGEAGNRRLVTSIELLSRSNKAWGSEGWYLYRKKQEEMLQSRVHLIEIDLLRGGEHSTAVPYRLLKQRAGDFEYHVCTHRFDRPREFSVRPIRLFERLPPITIPLLPGDPPVEAELQMVFDRCYETGGYGREINYQSTEPVPPLTADQAAWAMKCLRDRLGDVPSRNGGSG